MIIHKAGETLPSDDAPLPDLLTHGRRSRKDPVSAAVLLILTLVAAAVWLVTAGIASLFVVAGFGGVGGWVWAILYLLVTFGIILAGWPFGGRRVVALIGVVVSIVGGVWIARSATYSAGRLEQMLRHLPAPASGRLVATTEQDSCFMNGCPEVNRYFLVPESSGAVAAYGQVLLTRHFHLSKQGNAISNPNFQNYEKGNLALTIQEVPIGSDPGWPSTTHVALPQSWVPDQTGEVSPPDGYEFLRVTASQLG